MTVQRDLGVPVYEHDHEDANRYGGAGHHTLGIHRYQASPGNHTHQVDDPTSIPIFEGLTIEIGEDDDLQTQVNYIWSLLERYGLKVIRT